MMAPARSWADDRCPMHTDVLAVLQHLLWWLGFSSAGLTERPGLLPQIKPRHLTLQGL